MNDDETSQPEVVACSSAERMLLESRRAAAEELYRRADDILGEAVAAVLDSHAVTRGTRRAGVSYRDGAMVIVLSEEAK